MDLQELRLLVAEKMGWRELQYNRFGGLVGKGPGREDIKPVPHFGQSIDGSWPIIDEIHRRGLFVSIATMRLTPVPLLEVKIGSPHAWLCKSMDRNAALAIAEAFVQIKGPNNEGVGK
jgi:hypothetical protein